MSELIKLRLEFIKLMVSATDNELVHKTVFSMLAFSFSVPSVSGVSSYHVPKYLRPIHHFRGFVVKGGDSHKVVF